AHRRRATMAGCEAGRARADPRPPAGRDRRREPGTRPDIEPAPRGPEPDGRGRGLPEALGRVRVDGGGAGAASRPRPQLDRQLSPAPEASRTGSEGPAGGPADDGSRAGTALLDVPRRSAEAQGGDPRPLVVGAGNGSGGPERPGQPRAPPPCGGPARPGGRAPAPPTPKG